MCVHVCVCMSYGIHYVYPISPQKMCPHSPNMVLQAMADWYMQGDVPDQSRLPRILDVAQDPKVRATFYAMYRPFPSTRKHLFVSEC